MSLKSLPQEGSPQTMVKQGSNESQTIDFPASKKNIATVVLKASTDGILNTS